MTNVLVPRTRVRRAAPVFGLTGNLDRVLDEVWRGFGFPVSRVVAEPGALAPRMDFRETEDELHIAAERPGLEEKDIDVSIEDDILTVKGERARENTEEDEKGWRRRETFRGHFRRSVRLPEGVDTDAVKASYKAGILTITVPKPAEAKPEVRSIPIETA